MAGEKNPKLLGLEQSLIQFLTNKKEVDDKVAGGFRRVRGLSLSLDTRNPKKPLFTVQIGMCEAAFDILTGYKERGSCFGIERLIIDWYSRPSVREEIKTYISKGGK